MIRSAFQSLSHLFFPHICTGCGSDIINTEQLLCFSCIDRLPITDFHRHADNPVEKVFWGRIPVSQATSYIYFSKDSLIQQLLHEFKYKGNTDIGLYFGRKMGESLVQSDRFPLMDGLVPLPLHTGKERKRGYNQAKILCDGMAEVLKVPILDKAIMRTRKTETQTHKSRVERWMNMEGKFRIEDPALLENRNILLVDDVITTGATLEACGYELMRAKGLLLSIATLAYTSV
jgi:ComF family protein